MIYCRSGNSLKENPKMEKLRSAPPLLIGLLPYLSKYGEMIMWNSAYLEPFRCQDLNFAKIHSPKKPDFTAFLRPTTFTDT